MPKTPPMPPGGAGGLAPPIACMRRALWHGARLRYSLRPLCVLLRQLHSLHQCWIRRRACWHSCRWRTPPHISLGFRLGGALRLRLGVFLRHIRRHCAASTGRHWLGAHGGAYTGCGPWARRGFCSTKNRHHLNPLIFDGLRLVFQLFGALPSPSALTSSRSVGWKVSP